MRSFGSGWGRRRGGIGGGGEGLGGYFAALWLRVRSVAMRVATGRLRPGAGSHERLLWGKDELDLVLNVGIRGCRQTLSFGRNPIQFFLAASATPPVRSREVEAMKTMGDCATAVLAAALAHLQTTWRAVSHRFSGDL